MSIGAGSFQNLSSFTISHNPELIVFETGHGYVYNNKVFACAFGNIKTFVLNGKSTN